MRKTQVCTSKVKVTLGGQISTLAQIQLVWTITLRFLNRIMSPHIGGETYWFCIFRPSVPPSFRQSGFVCPDHNSNISQRNFKIISHMHSSSSVGVAWARPRSVPQRSRSHLEVKCQHWGDMRFFRKQALVYYILWKTKNCRLQYFRLRFFVVWI